MAMVRGDMSFDELVIVHRLPHLIDNDERITNEREYKGEYANSAMWMISLLTLSSPPLPLSPSPHLKRETTLDDKIILATLSPHLYSTKNLTCKL
jgi:hypothetical protein